MNNVKPDTYLNERDKALSSITDLLFNYGLQDTLLYFIKGLEKLVEKRGKSIESVLMIEVLKGLYAGYLRRYEPEDESVGVPNYRK